jgi:hypothetical protein
MNHNILWNVGTRHLVPIGLEISGTCSFDEVPKRTTNFEQNKGRKFSEKREVHISEQLE